MLAQRLWRWTNITPELGERLVFSVQSAGVSCVLRI